MAETQTLTLADFLLARIAEDEAVAQEATPAPWTPRQVHLWEGYDIDGGGRKRPPVAEGDTLGAVGGPDAEHITRWHPARVLAECEAKRRILDEHWAEATGWLPEGYCVTCSDDEHLIDAPCATVRLLALPYQDHPDFRDEWRP